MTAKSTGGPAFPLSATTQDFIIEPGMTLRDWFAGQAISSCSSNATMGELKEWFGQYATTVRPEQIRAKKAYLLADAMLAEREKEKKP